MEELLNSARTERIVTAALAAQGADVKITDTAAEYREFVRALNEPLDAARVRAAMMKEATS